MSSAEPSSSLASACPLSMTRTLVPGSSHALASQAGSVRRSVHRSTSCRVSAIPPETEIREPVTASEYGLPTAATAASALSGKLVPQVRGRLGAFEQQLHVDALVRSEERRVGNAGETCG